MISIEPAPSDERTSLVETAPLWANSHEIARARVASLLEVFQRHAGTWVSIRAAADELGVENHRDPRIASGVRELVADGSVEHNGKKRHGSAYRYVEPSAAPIRVGPAPDLGLVPVTTEVPDVDRAERAAKYAARARWAIA